MIGKWIPADIVSRALLLMATVLLVVVLLEIADIATGPAATELVTADDSTPLPAIPASASTASDYPPLGSFGEILQRPLYEATRRPVQAKAVVQDTASADRLRAKWRLSGIIIDERNIAILETVRAGETLSLVVGQSVDGWRVQQISENDVVLVRGAETLRFALHEGDGSAATGARKRVTQIYTPSRN